MRKTTVVIGIYLLFYYPLLASNALIQKDTLEANKQLIDIDSLILKQNFYQAEDQLYKAANIFKDSRNFGRQAYCLIKIAQIKTRKFALDEALDMLKVAEEIIQKANARYPMIAAETYHEIGSQYLKKDPEIALYHYKKALSLQQNSNKSIHQTFDFTIDQLAKYYYGKQQNDSAIHYFNRLIELRKNLYEGDHIQVGKAYINTGMTYSRIPDDEKAIELLNKGIDLYKRLNKVNDPSVATAYNTLGIIHNNLGFYDKSEAYLQKSLDIRIITNGPKHRSVAYSYNSLGLLAIAMGKNDQALDHFHKSLDIRRKVYGENHPLVAKTYNNLGLVKEKMGAYDEAIALFQKAIRELSKIFGPNHRELFNSYNNLGLIHHHKKEYQQAIELFEKTLEIQKQTFGQNHYLVGRTNSNLGEVYRELALYDKATDYFKRALQIHRETLGDTHQETAQILTNYGRTLSDSGAPREGLNFYLEAAGILDKAVSAEHPEIIENLLLQVEALLSMQDYETASVILQQSHQLSSSSGTPLYLRSLQLEIEMLNLTANGQKSYFNFDRLRDRFFQADSIVLNMQASLLRYEDRLYYSRLGNDLYLKAVSLFYEASKNNNMALDDAFYFAERSRASLLAQNLLHNQALSFSGLPVSLLTLEKDLKEEISHYQTLINSQNSPNSEESSSQKYYREKLFLRRRKLDSLIGVFEKENPAYYQMKYDRNIFSLEDIQAKLDDDAALIEYVETDDAIFSFVLTKSSVDFHKIETKDAILSGAQQYLKAIQRTTDSSSISDFKKWSSYLYDQLLLAPLSFVPHDKSSIILIPSASLSLIPWESFIEDLSGDSYSSLSYLIKKYNIDYAHSANLLFGEKYKAQKQSYKSVLALAPSYEGVDKNVSIKEIFRDQLVPLQWNRPEASMVSEALNGDIYEGASATELNFKKEASNYQILHLAMHALVDHEESMNSKLVFTQSNDSIEDGMLHTFEVFNMELPAEMVVLSACNTGVGHVQEGEGIMSLARSFAYAGVPSVIMSHWNVNDESTAKLMALFYKHLAEGQRKDEALKNAKLEFLKEANEIQASPYFWGGFVLVGDTDPIEDYSNNYWWLLVMIPLLGFYWQSSKKKMSQS